MVDHVEGASGGPGAVDATAATTCAAADLHRCGDPATVDDVDDVVVAIAFAIVDVVMIEAEFIVAATSAVVRAPAVKLGTSTK